MERFYYDSKREREGDLGGSDVGADTTSGLEGFFVYDGIRGCSHVMAICEDRDDAEHIVKALNASAS